MRIRLLLLSALLLPGVVYSSCVQFQAEAEAFSGVVPRLDENGKIRAYIMYGEASFLAPKRSLVVNARRQAELEAKRAFSEFLESGFSAEEVRQKMINQIELTNQDGDTAGLAEEISSSLETMRSNTSATLSGIVKLDECVDTEGKYVMVALGWKPEMSRAARQATQGLAGQSDSGGVGASGASGQAATAQSGGQGATETQTRRVGNVDIITVVTEGIGGSLKSATNEALRLAVSQVYGEAFASESISIDAVAQLEVTGSNGETAGVAVEQSLSSQSVSSSTAGIIRSWRYLERNETGGGFSVSLEVSIPQYQSTIDPNKLKVIVAAPTINPNVGREIRGLDQFKDTLRRRLEQSISQTNKLTVLERQYTRAIASELSRISQSANTMEMAKLGQQVGADLVIIPVIERFSSRSDVREVGQSVIEREIFDVEVSIKVAEVATSNLVATRSFPLNNRRLKPDNSIQLVADLVMQPINGFIGSDIGGGFNPNFQSTTQPQPDIAALSADAKKKMEEVKKNAESDW